MDLTLIWKALLIGVVEGLTEFLPVSSTGHIILAEEVLHFQGPPGKVFEIVIQLGAILAVCLLYRAKIWTTVEGVLQRDKRAIRFATAIAVAFLPAAIVGVAAHKYIKSVLFSPWVVAIALIVGGIAILLIERFAQRPRIKTLDDVDLKTALYIGLCQCLAMIPGVSRAGATIMGARAFRVDRATAAEFSFFMAIPTMVGAFALDFWQNKDVLTGDNLGIIAVGFVVSFISGLVVVRTMLDFINRYGLTPYGWWRIAVGVVGLGVIAVNGA